ncbi:hypothetical protein [Cohnella cholangitidis]|uniref:Uncharacterized protein n=1 Tax=Cohnella cholangitidis TaxID=2598458 RepID=A0A7G5BTW6_9BACL|nr:hypothetical protein [Cohnella cholangitidis]QMV40400.1 hypothetical protein FPL14_03680 [Cohnella cholangitidis]
MGFKKMIGLDMQLPAGKLPGYYAQIVKGIAERAPLTDRYKELLIFNDLPAVIELLDHYKVVAERCELLWLPTDGVAPGELYEDYAIVTRNDNIFVDLALTALFALDAAKPDAEPAPALLQLEEHLIGEIRNEEQTIYMMDRQLTLLADRIATAYKCEIVWLDLERLL